MLSGVLIGLYVQKYFNLPRSSKSNTIVVQQTKPTVKPKPVSKQKTPQSITIDYDVYGFMPNIIHASVGTQIIVRNTSGGPMYFQALPDQPNQNPELDLGFINNGQEKSFVLTITGTWQFQNQYETSDRGLITTNFK
jgi:hypothetical protein